MSRGARPWRHPGYAAVFALVEARAGLQRPAYPPAAEEGIDRAMARAGLTDFQPYLERLAADPAALDDLLVELTIGETYFFRHPEHFDFLRQEVLPDVRRRRGERHEVRAWSAGCASGEEAYSLAITLVEAGCGSRMKVWATDISRAALERARAARYSPWSLRGPQADRVLPFLRKEGKRYVLSPEVRERVHFGPLNLAEDTYPSSRTGLWRMDVIFCRNVLIYLNRSTVEAVARRFHATLAEGGVLITGPSDPPLGELAPLETLVLEWGLAYRRPAAAPVRRPLRRTPEPTSAAPSGPPGGPPFPAPAAPSLLESHAPAPPASPAGHGLRPAPPSAPRPPDVPAATSPVDVDLEGARRALARGEWRQAARLAGVLVRDATAAAVAVRALANVDAYAAARACAEAIARHPFAVELRYLEALLLLGLGRLPEAERAARQALYLEPSLAVAHLVLGHILRQRGDVAGAGRAYRAAEALCATLPLEAPVPLTDGERAGRLAEAARGARTQLEAQEEAH